MFVCSLFSLKSLNCCSFAVAFVISKSCSDEIKAQIESKACSSQVKARLNSVNKRIFLSNKWQLHGAESLRLRISAAQTRKLPTCAFCLFCVAFLVASSSLAAANSKQQSAKQCLCRLSFAASLLSRCVGCVILAQLSKSRLARASQTTICNKAAFH